MNLLLQTPQEQWPERVGVRKILVETSQGLLAILPRHMDCVVPVYPGILTLEIDGLEHLAVNRGLLVKRGRQVTISARELIAGELASLTAQVDLLRERRLESESASRSAKTRLESSFTRRFLELRDR